MVFFPQTWVELWEYHEDEDVPNFFGETTETQKFIGEYFVDFQNLSPKDSQQEYGKILEDAYRIYFDVDVPVTDTMIIRKKGEITTDDIKGSPQKDTTLIPHIKVTVQRTRKPVKLPSK